MNTMVKNRNKRLEEEEDIKKLVLRTRNTHNTLRKRYNIHRQSRNGLGASRAALELATQAASDATTQAAEMNSRAKNAARAVGEDAATGNEDCYSVLGVPTNATDAQLKSAYQKQSVNIHPDRKGGSAAAFQRLTAAYQTLINPETRQLYDEAVNDVMTKKRNEGYSLLTPIQWRLLLWKQKLKHHLYLNNQSQ